MAYYNYHAKLKQLLLTRKYVVVPETGKFAYRFIFDNGISMPIRAYRICEYIEYLK